MDTPSAPIRPLVYAQPAGGVTNTQHFVFVTDADTAVKVGDPTEQNESDRIEWISLARIPQMIYRREIVSSATLVGIMALLLDVRPRASASASASAT